MVLSPKYTWSYSVTATATPTLSFDVIIPRSSSYDTGMVNSVMTAGAEWYWSSSSTVMVKASLYTEQDSSKRFTLPWQTCSLRHHLGFSGNHPAKCYNLCANAARTHIHHCLKPGTHLYSWVNWSNVEWKNLLKALTSQHRIRTRDLVVESSKLYPEPLRS